MGYIIVYDRLFLRCGDKYIPFCLYGSNNCSMYSYRAGREIRERSWKPFAYHDGMILGTKEEIMHIVKECHPGNKNENFVFHNKWLNDEQVVRFFENGIKSAVTVEDIRDQAHETLCCRLYAYMVPKEAKEYVEGLGMRYVGYNVCKTLLEKYPGTADELVQWVEEAKAEKERLLKEGLANNVLISITCGDERPLKVYAQQEFDEPCVLYTPDMGYLKDITPTSVSFASKHWEYAKVYPNSKDAYFAVAKHPLVGPVKAIALKQLQKKAN